MSESTTSGRHARPDPEHRPEASSWDREVQLAAVTWDLVARWRNQASDTRAGLTDPTRARPRTGR